MLSVKTFSVRDTVAGCLTHRRMRDRVRLNLGTQVTIVHLAMELEDIRTRLTRRHQESVDILMVSRH